MTARLDLVGQRFGRLAVEALDPVRSPTGNTRWVCRCDCGTARIVLASSLVRSLTRSCGCLQSETRQAIADARRLPPKPKKLRPPGHAPTRSSWDAMVSRCYRPSSGNYAQYGAKGISVCERWRTYSNFLSDMGMRPAGRTLDRIDGTKGYEPGNCRWATPTEQQNNMRSNRRVTAMGETRTIAEWSSRTGLAHSVIQQRLARGWPPDAAVSTPKGSVTGWTSPWSGGLKSRLRNGSKGERHAS